MADKKVKTGSVTVTFEYDVYNYGTDTEPVYDFSGRGPIHELIESDEWFPTVEELESYIRSRLGVRR